MHAVVVEVGIETGHEKEAGEFLQNEVLPAMKNIPGICGGYWLAANGGEGLTVLLFDSEEAARTVADGLPDAPRAEYASLRSVDVRPVVGHF